MSRPGSMGGQRDGIRWRRRRVGDRETMTEEVMHGEPGAAEEEGGGAGWRLPAKGGLKSGRCKGRAPVEVSGGDSKTDPEEGRRGAGRPGGVVVVEEGVAQVVVEERREFSVGGEEEDVGVCWVRGVEGFKEAAGRVFGGDAGIKEVLAEGEEIGVGRCVAGGWRPAEVLKEETGGGVDDGREVDD